MKRIFLVTLLLILSVGILVPFLSAEEPPAPVPFPDSWIGKYSGPLEILGVEGATQTLTMHMEVAPSENRGQWHWRLQYKGQPMRDYVLIEVVAAAGHYRIDEKNGIVLEAQRFGDELHSVFSMNGMVLNATYRNTEEGIEFRITTVREEAATTTGGESGIPAVGSHGTIAVQRALLKKVE